MENNTESLQNRQQETYEDEAATRTYLRELWQFGICLYFIIQTPKYCRIANTFI
jgi:hypothetical protein